MTVKTTWTLFFDGACKPTNPGKYACFGWVLKDPTGKMRATGKGLLVPTENITNNVAEYGALEEGLKYVIKSGLVIPRLLCLGDSKLVVMTVAGKWRAKKAHLLLMRERVRVLLKGLISWEMKWISREENEEADVLSQGVRLRCGAHSTVVVY